MPLSPSSIALALLALAFPRASQETDSSELRLARACFAEARRVSDADGASLWGKPFYGPILLVDPIAHRIYANEDARADGAGLEEHDGVFVGPQPSEVFGANAAQEWRGRRWTTVVWQGIPRSTVRRRILLAHEMFHRLQPELGFSSGSRPNQHLDSEAGRTWLRLELRALSAALLASGDERTRALHDALLFRAHRHELFEGSAASERVLELNEGLAQYTGMRLSGLSEGARATWAAQWIADVESQEGADPIWLKRRLEGAESPASFTRTFPYATGAAYGLLLDGYAAGWHRTLDADFDFGARAASATKFEPPADVAGAARERAEAYEGWLVELGEARWQAEIEKRRAAFRQRLVDAPVLVLPFSGKKSLSFQSDELTTLPGVGLVYHRVVVRATWGTLRVDSGGALTHLDANGNATDVAVAAPASGVAARSGDGWSLELAPGWELAPGERAGDLVAREAKR